MGKEQYEQILEFLQIAYACIAADGSIQGSNAQFNRLVVSPAKMKIEDCIPEVVGLESVMQELIAGKRSKFTLKFVQRNFKDEIRYYHFHLLKGQTDTCPIVFFAQDATEQALNRQKILQQRNEILLLQQMAAERRHFLSSSILGNSPPIRQLREMVQKIARVSSSSVLLLGESGTGKNLVANVIHYNSSQAKYPFVEINCAAIPESLLEAELFGYEKGAFTTAVNAKQGLLEEAHQGTLFLDEIAELPLKLQAKLLSVLEAKTFRRLGSNKQREVEFRLIAATNRDLADLVRRGEFREDLFYRLNVVSLKLPPLREMGEDVLIIADHFREVFNLEFKKDVRGFSPEARQALLAYHWPGNVRELSNCIERAMIFTDGPVIEKEQLLLQPLFKEEEHKPRWQVPDEGLDLEKLEVQLIRSALEKAKGNKTKAAELLGLSRDTLRYRMEKYHIV